MRSKRSARLLIEARRTYAGQAVVIDVPAGHAPAQALVRAAGLTVQRSLMRMRRGAELDEDPARLWASSGPEKG